MLIQLTMWLRQQRKIRFSLRRLKAYYLHEAYARVANRIDSEAQNFYTKMIHLAGEYIQRIEHIQREVIIPTNQEPRHAEIPTTTFNQPLHGGLFAGRQLLEKDQTKECMVRVNYSPKKFSNLTPTDYFLLINQFHRDFMRLFDNVYLTTNFMKEFDPETGEERLLSKAEQEQRKTEAWQQDIQYFKDALQQDMAYILVPREYPSVGEKLQEYSRQTQRRDVLLPAIEMAAANGELISSADDEYADIKTNLRDINTLCAPYLPVSNTKYQIEPYDPIYQKYMFITRWQSFEHLPLNRILPTEDFDINIREQLVYQEEQKAAARKNAKKNNIPQQQDTVEPYQPQLSSLLLWALCPDDTSSLWFRLFDAQSFTQALNDRQKYREILNQED